MAEPKREKTNNLLGKCNMKKPGKKNVYVVQYSVCWCKEKAYQLDLTCSRMLPISKEVNKGDRSVERERLKESVSTSSDLHISSLTARETKIVSKMAGRTMNDYMEGGGDGWRGGDGGREEEMEGGRRRWREREEEMEGERGRRRWRERGEEEMEGGGGGDRGTYCSWASHQSVCCSTAQCRVGCECRRS